MSDIGELVEDPYLHVGVPAVLSDGGDTGTEMVAKSTLETLDGGV
jgi:hypothetical protein